MNDWPPLSDFPATIGRLATAEDTRANRASFLLEVNGERIGSPIEMPLPCYARFIDHESGDRQRCVLFQAEEADGKRYFGGWLLEEKRQIVGLDTDFEIVAK
ncbi:hypothetical protein [Nibricoccus aquaticus]|nr:hypothetical protein [Nibricoccus aquaticus]